MQQIAYNEYYIFVGGKFFNLDYGSHAILTTIFTHFQSNGLFYNMPVMFMSTTQVTLANGYLQPQYLSLAKFKKVIISKLTE